MNGYRPSLILFFPVAIMVFMAATSVWDHSIAVLPATRGSVTTTVLVGLGSFLPVLGWLAHENHKQGQRIQQLEDHVRLLTDTFDRSQPRDTN